MRISTCGVLALGALGALATLAALWFLSYPAREKANVSTCHSSIVMLADAMKAYATDNDEKLPVRPWQEVFWNERCPDDRSQNDPSYALHSRWLREPLVSGKNAAHLILLYESTPEPFAYRHYDGMNVGFVDGHVKFYKEIDLTPAQIIIGKR